MRRQRAFTLIDLLAAVVVVGLLGVVLVPGCQRERDMSHKPNCTINVSRIAKGVALYSSMSSDQYPFPLLASKGDANAKIDNSTCGDTTWAPELGTNAMQNVWLLVEQNMVGVDYFHCPLDKRWTRRSSGSQYGWCADTEFSYGVQFPYDYDAAGKQSAARLSDSNGISGLVIFADRNPGGSVGPGRAPSNHPDGESYARRDTSAGFYKNTANSNAGYSGDDIYVNTAGAAGGTPMDVSGASSGSDTSICPGK